MKIGLFKDGHSVALDELAKTLNAEGIETEVFTAADAAKGNIFRYDVLYFGGGWGTYDWLDLDGRMNVVEFAQNRGGGVIFSMFRCGWAARSGIRPIFPEVAEAYNKANGRLIEVVAKDHPLTKGLPGKWLQTYNDCASLRLGPEGIALAVDGGGRVTWCCGEAGKGRVFFLGTWLGLSSDGKPCYPIDPTERVLLLNATRWLTGQGAVNHSTNTAVSAEVQLKVLRREVALDWLHDEHGRSYLPGLLFQVKHEAETALDDLQFRAMAVNRNASGEALRGMGELLRQLAEAQAELRDRYERAKTAFDGELQRMSAEELLRFRDSYMGRRDRVDMQRAEALEVFQRYQRRIVPEQSIQMLQARVQTLEAQTPAGNAPKAAARLASEPIAPWLEALKKSTSGVEREQACLELGRIGDVGAMPALLQALRDTEYAVRRNAVFGLGWMQAKEAVPALMELAARDTDVRIRRRAAQALGQIGDERAIECLSGLLKDPDRYVRENAVLGLGWLGAKSATPKLVKILQTPRTTPMADHKLSVPAVSSLDDKENVWAHDDKVYALRALGHIGDAQTVSAIQECARTITNQPRPNFYITGLTVTGAVELALEEISKGGRGAARGIEQPAWSRDRDAFDWLRQGYHAFLGRPFSYNTMPTNALMKAKYAQDAGTSGFIDDITFYTGVKHQFGARKFPTYPEVDDLLDQCDQRGLKMIPYWYRRGTAIIDKSGMEYDVLNWGKYRAFGGYWAEEALWWDGTFRNDKLFRLYLERKYDKTARRELGLSDLGKVVCPEASDEGRENKVLWAEYMEYLADRGVEAWQEGADWLMGLRKGTYLMFSLSQRYVQGKSTYINAYPRISGLLGANGPQDYSEHSYENNFHLEAVAEGGLRPAQGQFYAHQADSPESVERGFASSFVHGQCFFVWWMGYIFKHPSEMAGCGGFDKGRWAAAERQFRKGRAISEYLAPALNYKAICLLLSGRTATLTYGSGTPDALQNGRAYRYSQNQEAIWQALIQSHLPVDVVWLETLTPGQLAQYPAAIVSDGVSLASGEENLLRNWVKGGGVLVATGRTTTHDQWDRERKSYGLGDVFGVEYKETRLGANSAGIRNIDREIKPVTGIERLRVLDERYLANMESKPTAEYELGIGYDTFAIQSGKVVAVWTNGTPAAVENAYGRGLSVLMSPVYPGLSHQTLAWSVNDMRKEYWDGSREWLAACVKRALDFSGHKLFAEVQNCPQDVELVIKQQDDHKRWMIHLLNMDPRCAFVEGVKLKLHLPANRAIAAISYIYPWRVDIPRDEQSRDIELEVRRFDAHEIIVIDWK
ncbi:MAG: HEAT repeat domain-containing protein [Kiritimatiellae bacterium]|nr:HEAT repeat domain-containing protein [Kiritimatiellia bacterium]